MAIVRLIKFTFEDGSEGYGLMSSEDKDEYEMDDLAQGRIDVVFSRALEVSDSVRVSEVLAKIESLMLEPKELH